MPSSLVDGYQKDRLFTIRNLRSMYCAIVLNGFLQKGPDLNFKKKAKEVAASIS